MLQGHLGATRWQAWLPLCLLVLPLTMGVRECKTDDITECEMDGQTYKPGDIFEVECNTCHCGADGSMQCTLVGCDLPITGEDGCGGLQGLSCAEDEYCQYAPEDHCGAADQLGTCEPIPDACIALYDPVCGCDDQTYGNACEAAAQGVSVASEGSCGDEDGGIANGSSCGGLSGEACPKGEFCNFAGVDDSFCGAADATGVCEIIPEFCTEQYAPVCGCDGETYENACAANAEGISVANEGACEDEGAVCGTRGAEPCPDGSYCDYPESAQCGATDAPGSCKSIPEVCPTVEDPVCGCDGESYSNACVAHAKGVSVASLGRCGDDPSEPQACGGLSGLTCDDPNAFCNFASGDFCGAADATGVCTPRPEACITELSPVCGCDGKPYANECEAHREGVAVANTGDCEAVVDPDPGTDTGRSCGGLLGGGCDKGEFCSYPLDAICGAADAPGTCAPRPDFCTQQYDPVCGCNGQTYGNACMAANAGVSIASKGECSTGGSGTGCEYGGLSYPAGASFESEDGCNLCSCTADGGVACTERACAPVAQDCGGIQGLQCADGEYCNYPETAQCGAADQLGQCAEVPQACTREYRPVCGCDDQTYGNACTAASAGVSVASQGACM